MIKKLILLFLFIMFCLPVAAEADYKPDDTISLRDFLYSDKSKQDWKTLKLNENGDVIFKEKVVLTNKGEPLNDNTAYTTIELKILFAAEGIKPRRFCNPRNTLKNGTLGCYIDNPDKKKLFNLRH